MDDVIRVAAMLLRDEAGRVLTVRKQGTERFMHPGGKPEPGESYFATALRECREELGVELDASRVRPVGVFTAEAANEPGYTCEGTFFEYIEPLPIEPAASAEIAEIRWVDPANLPPNIAPLATVVLAAI
ncbi:MAG: NUDIX domain-containing protein [Promicromonosporaceae bacterium]|nr:NUDIX domain-containing protein [Promicromonosporaceae bacterium]